MSGFLVHGVFENHPCGSLCQTTFLFISSIIFHTMIIADMDDRHLDGIHLAFVSRAAVSVLVQAFV